MKLSVSKFQSKSLGSKLRSFIADFRICNDQKRNLKQDNYSEISSAMKQDCSESFTCLHPYNCSKGERQE